MEIDAAADAPDGRAAARASRRAATKAIRSLGNSVYLPSLILATGQGAMIPILVYAARDVHASTAVAGAIVALYSFGTMLFDLPAGQIVSRLGERRAASVASVLMGVGLTGCLIARSPVQLALGVFVQAAGAAVWLLVRLTHLTREAPATARGRAISLFGGIIRAGSVLGPFLFIAVASRHDVRPAFVIALIAVGLAWVWQRVALRHDHGAARQPSAHHSFRRLVRAHQRGFLTVGAGALAVMLLRGSRTAIVPLWATHIGLSASAAAALYAWSSLVDLALFYPAGVASDRFGRRPLLLTCITLLAVGHVIVPFTHAFSTLFLAAFVLAVGNGLGAGIVMTLGADLAPAQGRASFLALWRAIADGGMTAGPLVDSGVVAVASLSLAGPVVAALGMVGALVIAFFLREPTPGQLVTGRARNLALEENL